MYKASLLLLLLVSTNLALAVTVVVEPDDFSVDTDIRNSYPGVTLSVTQAGGGSTQTGDPVLVLDGFDSFNNRNLATTGTSVFGQPGDNSLPLTTGQHWDENTFGLLRADFNPPASFVQIDLLFDDDDTGALWAYDSLGNLLQQVQGSGDGRTGTPTATVSITRSSADIAYILAGGVAAEALFLDNLIFTNAIVVSIKPRTDSNKINPNSNAPIQVAILTEGSFDALQVDPSTVRFGPNEANAITSKTKVADVDRDGDADLIVVFYANQTGIACGDTAATLVGETFSGVSITGISAIETVGCK